MPAKSKNLQTIPVGPLGLIPMNSCTSLGQKVDNYLSTWRSEREN